MGKFGLRRIRKIENFSPTTHRRNQNDFILLTQRSIVIAVFGIDRYEQRREFAECGVSLQQLLFQFADSQCHRRLERDDTATQYVAGNAESNDM